MSHTVYVLIILAGLWVTPAVILVICCTFSEEPVTPILERSRFRDDWRSLLSRLKSAAVR